MANPQLIQNSIPADFTEFERSLVDKTEVALVAAPHANPATLRLADRLAEFCNTVQAKAA